MLRRALLQCFLMLACSEIALNRRYQPYKGRRYELTLFVRNHNVTDAKFFRLVGVDNTADFNVSAGNTFEHTFEVRRKGYWTLFVEFPGDRYAKSPKKIISRDSYRKWVMEVYYYPGAVGFSEWRKMRRKVKRGN
ncbi:hypothetical protein KIN20_034527 [Parelaphostrongylus tenuis]|uniref:Uncharacterized protein n=1 Tax=Parelaphostrongylus tenuis TaxID=148309 RepID=A0AAD5WJ94_PARTN|nr:hypothetical protein KIN20_034527 [Parelaphostrongylus tenuis]